MAGPSAIPPTPPKRIDSPSGQVNAGRDVTAGDDVAGRDVITETTYIGFDQRTVLRLLIVVGVLVFITAACFLSGGIAVGFGVFAAINRPVNSTPDQAQLMANKLQEIEKLPQGTRFTTVFTEAEISSYFRYIMGPQIGITNGKVRLLQGNRLVINGNVADLGGRAAIATFELQDKPGESLQLTGAAVQVFHAGSSSFGWVAVPTPLLQPLADQVNQYLGAGFRLIDAQTVPISKPGEPGEQPALSVDGVATGQ